MTPERLESLKAMLSGREPSAELGYGLFSVHQRIKLYYDQPQGLDVVSTFGEGTAISFCVPLSAHGGKNV
jgi:two-component system sensor histidine kinase YesM